jgi:HSP20 family protein
LEEGVGSTADRAIPPPHRGSPQGTVGGEGRAMRALLPENGVTTFKKEMDRLFDRFWEGNETQGTWEPRLDVYETKEAFLIKAEVPGIDPKDIQVNLENGVLVLRGEKKQEVEKKDERYYRSERMFGTFVRGLRLPTPVDGTKVNAFFKHGLLTIMLPKAAEAMGQSIPIKVD